jgi:hypothetical protein
MDKLEVTWNRVLLIWWSLAWRSVVFGAVAGAVIGALIGAIAGILGHADKARQLGAIGGQIVSIPISWMVLKIILQKRWKEFSIALVPNDK